MSYLILHFVFFVLATYVAKVLKDNITASNVQRKIDKSSERHYKMVCSWIDRSGKEFVFLEFHIYNHLLTQFV